MGFDRRLFVCLLATSLAIACNEPFTPGTGSTGTAPDAGAPTPLPDAGPAAPGGETDAGNGSGGSIPDAGTGGGGSGGDIPDAGTGGGSGGDIPDAGTGGGGTPDAGTGGGTATGPQQLTTGANAIALAIDATNVYFVSRAGTTDAVRSVRKSGGTAVTLFDGSPGASLQSLIATGDAVLWEGDSAIFESDGGSARRVAALIDGGGLAANATTAFSRSRNVETSRWDLLGCARDGSGCSAVVIDSPLVGPVYFDGGKLYYVSEPSDTDFGLRSSLQSFDSSADPFHRFESKNLQNVLAVSGLRVNGSAFALRSHGNVWAGHLDSTYAMIEAAPNGDDVDISHGRVYWNESGCLGSANIDGTDRKCIDGGGHDYAGVRVDETAVYFIRDGEIFRIAK